MGRSALVIKTQELQAVVNQLELATTFSSLGELCTAIEASDWGKGVRNEKHVPKGISAQVAQREIRARGISYNTKLGKRGREAGATVSKSSRKERAAKIDMGDFPERLRESVKDAPDRYKGLAELAIQGNPVAACKLKCGECMGYTGAEKACDGLFGGTPCPLYALNRLVFVKRRDYKKTDTGFYLLQALKGVAE